MVVTPHREDLQGFTRGGWNGTYIIHLPSLRIRLINGFWSYQFSQQISSEGAMHLSFGQCEIQASFLPCQQWLGQSECPNSFDEQQQSHHQQEGDGCFIETKEQWRCRTLPTSTQLEILEEVSVGNSARTEEIRCRAYEVYLLERSKRSGHDVDDWAPGGTRNSNAVYLAMRLDVVKRGKSLCSSQRVSGRRCSKGSFN